MIHIIEIELKQYLYQFLNIYQILADLNCFKSHLFLMFRQCCCCLHHQCNLWESLSSNLAAQNSLEVPPTTSEKSEKKKNWSFIISNRYQISIRKIFQKMQICRWNQDCDNETHLLMRQWHHIPASSGNVAAFQHGMS